MMMTYGLPRQGNGTFLLYAFAEDGTGHSVQLGTKEITSNNANRVKPFGSIDTPGQGETVSGTIYNFGWALTPPPKEIPRDGSTIWVAVDGVYIANPDYDNFRQDIYDNFPGYLNNDGAVGVYELDTTAYSNGVHNIGWYAVDDNGDADGFGSRFFEIQNTGGIQASADTMENLGYKEDRSGRLSVRIEGSDNRQAEQLDRIKIVLQGEGGDSFVGWGSDVTKGLPIGSTLDKEQGIFYWSIGPGFLNEQVLHFAVTDGLSKSQPVKVVINVVPKQFENVNDKKDALIK
jgi:hypothetical protein